MPSRIIDVRRSDDIRDVVHHAVQALAEGKLVAFPTETVYGLAANARRTDAVERLLDVKGRRSGHPLALAIRSADDALDYVPTMSRLARRLARRCWPGPVTLVLDDGQDESLLRHLPDAVQKVVVPEGTVGLRVPAHALIQDVLRMLAGPIALTSANRTGAPESVRAEEVEAVLNGDVQLILNDGPTRYGQPSSVVRVHEDRFELLRAGVVAESTLRRLSNFILLFVCTGNTCRSPMAETIARQKLAARMKCGFDELEDRGVSVLSAGIAAAQGGAATPEAAEVIQHMGLDLGGHESRPLTEQLVAQADCILTMTSAHRAAILDRWPGAADRVKVLRADRGDISDPIGGPLDVYRRCAEQIKTEIERCVGELDIL